MLPGPYNSNVHVLQAPGCVLILNGMIHEHRIIPLDGRPHLPQRIRQWMGDSRGSWEGSTLVVETTNFTDKTNLRGASENMRLIERFTRVDADTIGYEFTVDDSTSFTRPWTAQILTSHDLFKAHRAPPLEHGQRAPWSAPGTTDGSRGLHR